MLKLKKYIYFLIQFYVPFKIISCHMRRANQSVGRKRENPEKNHLTHPQAELGLSHKTENMVETCLYPGLVV